MNLSSNLSYVAVIILAYIFFLAHFIVSHKAGRHFVAAFDQAILRAGILFAIGCSATYAVTHGA